MEYVKRQVSFDDDTRKLIARKLLEIEILGIEIEVKLEEIERMTNGELRLCGLDNVLKQVFSGLDIVAEALSKNIKITSINYLKDYPFRLEIPRTDYFELREYLGDKQFTGLRDKDGQPVCEGSTVVFTSEGLEVLK